MPVQNYGLVVGSFDHFDRDPNNHYGNFFHGHIFVRAPDAAGASALYNCAVDVKYPNGMVEYATPTALDSSKFATIHGLIDGSHALVSTPTSGAIDYTRSSLLSSLVSGTGQTSALWKQNVGGSVLNDMEYFLTAAVGIQRIYVFGSLFVNHAQHPPQGVHDVHLNQGDPPGAFRPLDGIWQDGGVIVERPDGTIVGFFVKFLTQSLKTDANGLPI